MIVKVGLGNRKVTAVLDSGSAVSMIQAHLVPANCPPHCWTSVACLHRHTQRLPVVRVTLQYHSQAQDVDLVQTEELPYPLLLGRDAPNFQELVLQVLHQQGEATLIAEEEDPVEGPSGEATRTDLTLDAPTTRLVSDPQFRRAQAEDLTLEDLRANTAVEEGQVTDPRRAARYPRIEREAGLWWWRVPSQGGGDPEKQLVVPQGFRTAVLRFAHDTDWAGHPGSWKTIGRALRYFFWPSLVRVAQAHCRACPVCQKGNAQRPLRAPLCPLPVVDTPFERIAVDFIGPLPRTARGHR